MAGFLFSPTSTMPTPSRKARHPSAEGNFAPQWYVLSSPPLEGCPQGGVVRESKKPHLLPIVIASNKKALRAFRQQPYYTWIATVARQRFQR